MNINDQYLNWKEHQEHRGFESRDVSSGIQITSQSSLVVSSLKIKLTIEKSNEKLDLILKSSGIYGSSSWGGGVSSWESVSSVPDGVAVISAPEDPEIQSKTP